MGAFALSAPDGRRLELRSKKAIALLALLASAKNGERSRSWIQEHLWGSRALPQAQASLRRELYNLRKLTSGIGIELVKSDSRAVRLCLEHVHVDFRGDSAVGPSAEFLEGMDAAGERLFGEWLKSTRQGLPDKIAQEKIEAEADDRQIIVPTAQDPSDELTLLVMPFTTTGIADHPAEDMRAAAFRLVIEHLSRSNYFSISVWPLATDDPVKMPEIKEAAHQANARYGLLGHVVSQANAKSFSLSLFRAADGRVLWSEPSSLPIDTESTEFWLAVQRIVNRTIQVIAHEETRRALATEEAELGYAEIIWLVRSYLYSSDQRIFEKARKYIDLLLLHFPRAAESIIQDAVYAIVHQYNFGAGEFDEPALRQKVRAAIEADPTDVRGPACAAFVEILTGRTDIAIAHAQSVIQLVPGYIEGHSQLGYLYLIDGRLEDARACLQRALDLSPAPLLDRYSLAFMALYHALRGGFDDAIRFSDQALIVGPDEVLPILIKIHALTELGRADAAEQVFRAHEAIVRSRADAIITGLPFRDAAFLRRFRQSIERLTGTFGT
ncbi:MAG: tetratricopeptide repeat protein [Novosphingobium sp.]